MDLSNLSKEQKQYIALGAIGAAALCYGIFIGVNTVAGRLSEAKNELTDLTEKVNRAERELARRGKTHKEFLSTIAELEQQLEYLPPEVNYYSWATEIVYSKGRSAGLEVESVVEAAAQGPKAAVLAKGSPVYFETYSLRVTGFGGFEEVKRFLNDVTKSHPLVRFTGIEISNTQEPERHNVQLTLQWPFRLNRITELWQDEKRGSETDSDVRKEEAFEEEPMPMVAQAAPEPAPEPEPEKPAAAVVRQKPLPFQQPTPPEEPAPVERQQPSRVVVKLHDAEPVPEIVPEPVKEAPPVVVKAAAPQPVPEIIPAPPVEPEPVLAALSEPEPVIVPNEPAEADPVNVDRSFAGMLESTVDMTAETEEAAVQEEQADPQEAVALLAVPIPDPEPAFEPPEEEVLKPEVHLLVAEPAAVPREERGPTAPAPAAAPNGTTRYVNSSKSAKILEELLMRQPTQTSDSIGSFLDGIMGDINDQR